MDLQVVNKGAINLAAYLTYSTREACVLAIRNLNNKVALMQGQPMEVKFVTGPVPVTQPRTARLEQPAQAESQAPPDDPADPIQEYVRMIKKGHSHIYR